MLVASASTARRLGVPRAQDGADLGGDEPGPRGTARRAATPRSATTQDGPAAAGNSRRTRAVALSVARASDRSTGPRIGMPGGLGTAGLRPMGRSWPAGTIGALS